MDLGMINEECIERVERFCYLGNMLNAGGNVECAIRTCVKMMKCRRLLVSNSMLMNKSVYRWKGAGKYTRHAWDQFLQKIYGIHVVILERADMKMLQWMCRVKKWKIWSWINKLLERVGLEKLEDMLRKNCFRWLGHVEQKDSENLLQSVEKVGNDGTRPRVAKDLEEVQDSGEIWKNQGEWNHGIKVSNPGRESRH